MFKRFIKVEVVNPNTGEATKQIRVVTNNGEELKVLNTEEELKAFGKPTDCLTNLLLKSNEYGKVAYLRPYKVEGNLEW